MNNRRHRSHTEIVRRSARTVTTLVIAITALWLAVCTASSTSQTSPTSTSTSGSSAQHSESSRPAAPNRPATSDAPQASPTFHATGAVQIAEVSHLTRFIHAYNSGDLQVALAQFSRTKPVGFSDCDYATHQLVDGRGRAQLTAWLRDNLARHDRLILGGIFNDNPDQPLGVLGVSFSRRSSDAIAHAGHPNGITPSTGAKVKFDAGGLITEFNNGPYGGLPDSCRIS